MERVCFLGRVKAERLAEYRARHERVWPDMLAALQEAGWGNYSLFLTEDGLLGLPPEQGFKRVGEIFHVD
jgi:L-rhamnose mutarotase